MVDKIYDIVLYANVIGFLSSPVYEEGNKNPLKRFGEKFLEDTDLKENRRNNTHIPDLSSP